MKKRGAATETNGSAHPHIGRRVRVECSDGIKYDGIVSGWDRKLSEYMIVLDDGKLVLCTWCHRFETC